MKRQRLLVAIAVVAVLLTVVVGVYEVNERWVSRSERKLSMIALYSIDEIKDATDQRESLYDARIHEAEKAVAEAKGECLTKKDKDVATALDEYLNLRKQNSNDLRGFHQTEQHIDQLLPGAFSDPAYDERQQDRERKMNAIVDSARERVVKDLE